MFKNLVGMCGRLAKLVFIVALYIGPIVYCSIMLHSSPCDPGPCNSMCFVGAWVIGTIFGAAIGWSIFFCGVVAFTILEDAINYVHPN